MSLRATLVCLLLVILTSIEPYQCMENATIVTENATIVTENATIVTESTRSEDALAKLVRMFSKPGAFKRINALLGENSIEESSTSCPKGEEGLECRRAEARRSVDCPEGDCYCHNCAAAGPDLWASCCRESLRCCSHLAAACRTCDHPTLYPFCSKHFKKCSNQMNQKKVT